MKTDPHDMDAIQGEKEAAVQASIQRLSQGRSLAETPRPAAEAPPASITFKDGWTREQWEELLTLVTARHNADPANVNSAKSLAGVLNGWGGPKKRWGFTTTP